MRSLRVAKSQDKQTMEFHENTIYHIYNQGNNKQQIFFKEDNYRYFLGKMKTFMTPYGEFLAYCLMPNHFHFLFYVRTISITQNNGIDRTLNDSIGIMLRSYTSAINRQEKRSGSLFRKKTKAKDGSEEDVITLEGKNKGLFFRGKMDYAHFCVDYIHKNPVKAKLVFKPEEWKYSSAREFVGQEKSTLCNLEFVKELGLG